MSESGARGGADDWRWRKEQDWAIGKGRVGGVFYSRKERKPTGIGPRRANNNTSTSCLFRGRLFAGEVRTRPYPDDMFCNNFDAVV
jgi:hypothetical protein